MTSSNSTDLANSSLHNVDETWAPCPVHELFLRQAEANPRAPAIRSLQGDLSYEELNRSADLFARLLQDRDVKRGDAVAICADRTELLLIALLGILKAGAAYVPIVSTYPAERIDFMLDDVKAKLVIVGAEYRSLFPNQDLLVLDDVSLRDGPAPDPVASSPEDRAYVMYTSGSTGKPKGAAIPHRAIERLTNNKNGIPLAPGEVVLHAAPIAFDASTIEVWGPLLTGATVALYPDPVPTTRGLGDAIRRFKVTSTWITAALFNMVVDEDASQLAPLTHLISGGEALSVEHVRRANSSLPNTQLINGYGPTETTTFATNFLIPKEIPSDWTAIPIGTAIRETRLYVLGADLQPVARGDIGELFIGGAGLALRYENQSELTEKAFLDDPEVPGAKMYRTGDLVRVLPDGSINYESRADQQVKIRGFRIEPGEIETALQQHESIRAAAVVAHATGAGEKRLVAYCVTEDGIEFHERSVRDSLEKRLPDYMVPSIFMSLERLPVTDNGKLDRRALPAPSTDRPDLRTEYVAPAGETETKLAAIFSELLEISPIGVEDNFFELGGSSLAAVKVAAKIQAAFDTKIPAVKLFERPTVNGIALQLEGAEGKFEYRSSKGKRQAASPIAIIGMSGKFPGSADVPTFWRSLLDGREGISYFSAEELSDDVPESLRRDPNYIPARGIMPEYDSFDAPFFGITKAEANLMDPQQRVLMEVAWATLEDGGYVPKNYPGSIGIYAGKYNNTYFSNNVSRHPEAIEAFGAFNTMLANEKDYVATRTAYALNLTGPAISVHTACSTSLVCVAQAAQALRAGECDMALAGGVSITVPVESGYMHQEGTMLSPDGHTKTFSDEANGTVFSDGASMVLLKRLDDAIADGDHIYAVVRGVATNNDGGNKASLTAPSVDGQASVVCAAQEDADVKASDIDYIEAHGTATRLGDPVELTALKKAFSLDSSVVPGSCGIGSVKSNVGHTVIAAGTTGLIKTALSLQSEVLPPSLGYERPNPELGIEESPFYVTAKKQAWKRGDTPRLAGVSAFGVGGTNAHVVVEEAPLPRASAASSRKSQLFFVSGRTESSVRANAQHLAAHLSEETSQSSADVAFTLHAGREGFSHRAAVVAETLEDAAKALSSEKLKLHRKKGRAPKVALLFPGQGSQYAKMGATLYEEQPVFRANFDECASILRDVIDGDLRDLVFAKEGSLDQAEARLKETRITQPALFAVEYSMARLLEEWGLEWECSMGHSVGEFVSATLSGVMALEDALPLVAHRGRMMQEQAPGGMLSVRRGAKEIAPMLTGSLCIATDNAPQLCVVSGPSEEVAAFEQRLSEQEIPNRMLVTSHAFHSDMMEPVTAPFRDLVSKIELNAPKKPFVSTATGKWITDAEATDPGYWAAHLRLPVLFTQGLGTLLETEELLLVEAGPRTVLSTLTRQHELKKTQAVFSTLGSDDTKSWGALLASVGQLWMRGIDFQPVALHGPEKRRRTPLPTYRFERTSHWLGGKPAHAKSAAAEIQATDSGAASTQPAPAQSPVAPTPTPGAAPAAVDTTVRRGQARPLIDQQLRLMQRQLEILKTRRQR